MKVDFCLVKTYGGVYFYLVEIRMLETYFLSCENHFLLFNLFFFQQVEAVTEIRGKPLFSGKDFIPTSRKGFSVWWKLFFFYSVFLSCKSKPLLKLVETTSLYFLLNGRS